MSTVIVRTESGDIDVTEAVKTMYDLLRASMDWGSGFLSLEDVIEVTRLADLCGFVNLDGATEQIDAYLRMQGRCPTCFEGGDIGEGWGTWRMAQVTPEGRSVQHHPCGHVFQILMPVGEPASLVPGGPTPEPCTHENRPWRYDSELNTIEDGVLTSTIRVYVSECHICGERMRREEKVL